MTCLSCLSSLQNGTQIAEFQHVWHGPHAPGPSRSPGAALMGEVLTAKGSLTCVCRKRTGAGASVAAYQSLVISCTLRRHTAWITYGSEAKHWGGHIDGLYSSHLKHLASQLRCFEGQRQSQGPFWGAPPDKTCLQRVGDATPVADLAAYDRDSL